MFVTKRHCIIFCRNIQRAVGAYFDFSFENSPPCFSGMVNNSTTMTLATPSVNIGTFTRPPYDLRVWPSSTSSKGTYETFKVTVENSGVSQWHEGCYIRSEVSEFLSRNLVSVQPVHSQASGPRSTYGMRNVAPFGSVRSHTFASSTPWSVCRFVDISQPTTICYIEPQFEKSCGCHELLFINR
ncbi:hypothetical protein T265_00431 [Opisthorchis viverrini]|uniref:Uncharacterized protein n=1 Tax=Opisthorchis viverrini TaxID=6198 RepID=A0A075ACR1_OPIVI|nr:hypothetical protein T265_00431 [Opisthorchis viverrini]KER33750.1 hypothetical protein T265_00431 [Opisthorchis viverrini]